MSVCHGCTKRQLHCHSNCPDWDAEVERERARKELIWKQKKTDKVVGDILFLGVPDKGKKEIRKRIARLSKDI